MDELKKILMASVPLIGGVVGTINPLAGVLFSSIAHLFGLPTDSSAGDVANAIKADPDHDIKLRQLEVTHHADILNAATQIKMAAYEREKAFVASTGKRDWVMDFLSIFIVMAFFALAIVAFMMNLNAEKQNLCYFLLGVFGSGGFSCVVGYWFGSSPQTKFPSPIPVPKGVILPPPAETRKEN